jgi:hypothetical protein
MTVAAQAPQPDAAAVLTGMVHTLAVPENLLALLGLGLVVGMGGAVAWRGTVPCYLAGLAGACILLLTATLPAVFWLFSLVLALWLGLIAAAALDLPPWLVGALAAAVGFTAGLDVVPFGHVPAVTLALVVAGAAVLSAAIWLAVAFAASRARAPWQRIGCRIAGSWLAAIAALLLALAFAR